MSNYPSIKNVYRNAFLCGAAVAPRWLFDGASADVVSENFSSITCENEMKPEAVLDYEKTLALNDDTRVCVHLDRAEKVLDFARDHGIRVRAHTLLWHNQTPRWFFTEGYSMAEDAKIVGREKLLLRLESFIREEMALVNARYPGLVYAWDVVNEAIEVDDGNPNGFRSHRSVWYAVLGESFVESAFTFARRYALPGQKLFYNDYSCCDRKKMACILPLVRSLKEKGLIDGLGMQMHIHMDWPSREDFRECLDIYGKLGLTLHLTEMDIKTNDNSEEGQKALGERYREIFEEIVSFESRSGNQIESVTFWGLSDAHTWLSKPDAPCYPLLFDENLRPKPAYFGAIAPAM